MNTEIATGSKGTQKLNHIHNVYFHSTDDAAQAMHGEFKDLQMNKRGEISKTMDVIKQKAMLQSLMTL